MSNLSQEERDKLPLSDFAEPDKRGFPIVDASDVSDAAHLVGKAADPDAVRERIIAIAKRKGFSLPDAWKGDGDKKTAREAMATSPVTPLTDRVEAPVPKPGLQQHDHAHSHGTFTHSHPHRHAGEDAHGEGDAYRDTGTGEHSVHTHCKTCGADDSLCDHGPRGGKAREAAAETQPDTQRVSISEALPLRVSSLAPDHKTGIVQLMSVGPGNTKSGFYYTEQAIRDVARLAPGRRMYISHSGSADKDRGHRDPLQMASVVKEAWYDAASQAALGKVRFLPTHAWLPTVLAEEPDAVQVSVEGLADGRPGDVGGKRYRCVVEHMEHVDSADWVPEAGARGRFLRFAEAATTLDHKEELEMLEGLTAQEVRETNPTLFAEIARLGGSGAGANTASTVDTERIVKEATTPLREELDRLYRERNEEQTALLVRESLQATGLPAGARAYLATRFEKATVGEGGRYPTRDALDVALTQEVTAYRGTLPQGNVTGLGYGAPLAVGESAAAGAGATRSSSEVVSDIIGDLMGVRKAAATGAQ